MRKLRGTAARRKLWSYCYMYSVMAFLLSLKVSTATYNPSYHPQHGTHGHHTTQTQDYTNQVQPGQWRGEPPPRGGSTMTAPEDGSQYNDYDQSLQSTEPSHHEMYPEPEPFQPPRIHLKHMSMALRLTSEWNRRLHDGVNRFRRVWGSPRTQTPPHGQYGQQYYYSQNNGHHPVNINPARSWHPPIPEGPPGTVETELTLFHAKAPRDTSDETERRGVARWGPDLLPYLEHIVELLGVSDGVEIPLAMIYLDRACSVETPRSNGVPPCPFCTPRTVHRLSLAALILAKQAIDGNDDIEVYYDRLQALGIPLVQLQQMVDWMRAALGDQGVYVTVRQMKDWSQTWDSIFHNKVRQPQVDQSQQTPPQQIDTPSEEKPWQ